MAMQLTSINLKNLNSHTHSGVYTDSSSVRTVYIGDMLYSEDELESMIGTTIQLKDDNTIIFNKEEVHFKDEADLGAIIISKLALLALERE